MNVFEKLNDKYNKVHVNTSVFDDSIAERISWEPLFKGGANFRTRKLVRIDSTRIEFKKTVMMKIFPLFFLAFPVGIFISFYLEGEISFDLTNIDIKSLLILVVPAFFFIIGIILLQKTSKSIVFDKRSGYFWKGNKNPNSFNPKYDENYIKLDQIYAIQLLKEYMTGSKSSSGYYSYEINLVLKNEKRVNVIDHGNKKYIYKDSEILSKFLQVPVWNSI